MRNWLRSFRWPFILVSTHERVRRENWFLRDALREANSELLKHRKLIGGIRNGSIDLVKTFTEKK